MKSPLRQIHPHAGPHEGEPPVFPAVVLRTHERDIPGGPVSLILEKQDFSSIYPGMVRYTVWFGAASQRRACFHTNTYEYPPLVPLNAEEEACRAYDRYVERLHTDPDSLLFGTECSSSRKGKARSPHVVIIQGSPRAQGNCAVLAGWSASQCRSAGRTVSVIFCDELDIHPCIGCYQCYNTGTCTFDDEMGEIISSIGSCHLLVVCTPVYSNTVPGPLKVLIDRSLACHARRMISGDQEKFANALLLAVAGRKGVENFTCTTHVIQALLYNLGCTMTGKLLVDGMDEKKDVRQVTGLFQEVADLVSLQL